MKTIWKYEIPDKGMSEVSMPKKHTILNAQQQYGRIKIWAIVDDMDSDVEKTTFHLIGTGEKLPTNVKLKYIATFQTFAGSQVHHLFEQI